MRRMGAMLLVAAFACFLGGCGDDNGGPPITVDDPPVAVFDLAVVAVDDSAVTLTWTAPADPTKRASVSAYDLRYSTSVITSENFASADTAHGEPAPGEEAAPDTFTVDGLDFATPYYFALRSVDDAGQWSGLSNVVQATTDSVDNRLIAYYPLVDNTFDVTGNYDTMTLYNTPFEEGGIYCNGIYTLGGTPEGCDAITPSLPALDFDSLTLSARFMVSEYYQDHHRPVFVGGSSYRWLGIRLQTDSTFALTYNNGALVMTGTKYTPGTWQEGVITFDGSTATLYVDGALLASATDVVLNHGNRRDVLIADRGYGTTLKGHFGRLKVYSGIVAP